MGNADAIEDALTQVPPALRKMARASMMIGDAVEGLNPAEGGYALEVAIRAIESQLKKQSPEAPNFREVMIQALGGYVGIGETRRGGIA